MPWQRLQKTNSLSKCLCVVFLASKYDVFVLGQVGMETWGIEVNVFWDVVDL